MPKVDLDVVKAILNRNLDQKDQVHKILGALETEIRRAEEENEKPPPVKKQWIAMVSDPEGKFKDEELVGWVMQIPEDANPYSTIERVWKASFAYNANRRGKKIEVETVGESCEMVPARFFKEEEVWVKTKLPIMFLPIKNRLPDASEIPDEGEIEDNSDYTEET